MAESIFFFFFIFPAIVAGVAAFRIWSDRDRDYADTVSIFPMKRKFRWPYGSIYIWAILQGGFALIYFLVVEPVW